MTDCVRWNWNARKLFEWFFFWLNRSIKRKATYMTIEEISPICTGSMLFRTRLPWKLDHCGIVEIFMQNSTQEHLQIQISILCFGPKHFTYAPDLNSDVVRNNLQTKRLKTSVNNFECFVEGQHRQRQGDEKYLTFCLFFLGLRIVNSWIIFSKPNQFLNQSYVSSEQICP
jgi:hypothetical protein